MRSIERAPANQLPSCSVADDDLPTQQAGQLPTSTNIVTGASDQTAPLMGPQHNAASSIFMAGSALASQSAFQPAVQPMGLQNQPAATSDLPGSPRPYQIGLPSVGSLGESSGTGVPAADLPLGSSPLGLHQGERHTPLPARPSRIPTPFTQAGIFQSPVKPQPAPEHRILPSENFRQPPAASQIPAPSQSAAFAQAAAASDSHLSELAADLRIPSSTASAGPSILGTAQDDELDRDNHAYDSDDQPGASLVIEDEPVRGRAMAR